MRNKKNMAHLFQLAPTTHSKHTHQPAALRLVQLLSARLDHGADAGDAEAQGAVLNSISACEKCVVVFCGVVFGHSDGPLLRTFRIRLLTKVPCAALLFTYQKTPQVHGQAARGPRHLLARGVRPRVGPRARPVDPPGPQQNGARLCGDRRPRRRADEHFAGWALEVSFSVGNVAVRRLSGFLVKYLRTVLTSY